jgi:hypothetical protein
VRKKGIVIYDADRPERTPAVALRERRAEYESVEVASEEIRRHVLSTRTKK